MPHRTGGSLNLPISLALLLDPEIIKMDSGGYMANFEINDLPTRHVAYKIYVYN